MSNSTESFDCWKLFVDEIVIDIHDRNVTIKNMVGVRPISTRITPYVGCHCHHSVVCREITRTYAAVRLLPPRSTDGYSLQIYIYIYIYMLIGISQYLPAFEPVGRILHHRLDRMAPR